MTAGTETIREADIEAIHRAIFHAPGDIHAAALAALGRVEERERALMEALREYGQHKVGCILNVSQSPLRKAEWCDCGLTLARAALADSVAAGSEEERE